MFGGHRENRSTALLDACKKRQSPLVSSYLLWASFTLSLSCEVGAVCGNSARTDLCGGRWATTVPTATKNHFLIRMFGRKIRHGDGGWAGETEAGRDVLC